MFLKKIALLLLIILSMNASAQTIIQTNKMVQEDTPMYLGGGIVLGGGSGSFQFGLNPELIKTYNQYLDYGLAVNLYYSSYKSIASITSENYKSNNTQLGIGGLVRAWPLEQLFIQLQPEYNWTFTNAKNISLGTSGSSMVSAPSLLTGLGYGKRNENGFSYFSIMFDLVNSAQSPYRMGQLKAQPIFRAGVGFPIRFPKKKNVK